MKRKRFLIPGALCAAAALTGAAVWMRGAEIIVSCAEAHRRAATYPDYADAVIPPDNVMFPAAPELACGGDAGDCALPPSACADPSCDGGTCSARKTSPTPTRTA